MGKVLLQKVFRKFALCDISPVFRAPFDFIMNIPTGESVIVGSVAVNGERNLERRMEEIISLCGVLRARPVLITEKKSSRKDIACVCMEELSAMRNPEDLVAAV
jgi:predicted transcriptional regulator